MLVRRGDEGKRVAVSSEVIAECSRAIVHWL